MSRLNHYTPYSKSIRITLDSYDIDETRCLADVFSHGDTVEYRHFAGAAGQIIVAKAFPQLKLNGHLYLAGDRGHDYINARIDTKTVTENKAYPPTLWIKRDLLDGNGPLVYIGVVMEAYLNDIKYMKRWTGRIYGFATISLLRDLLKENMFTTSKKYGYESVGFSHRLFPPSWLKFYLKLRNTENENSLTKFFNNDDLRMLDDAFSKVDSSRTVDFPLKSSYG